MIFLKKSFWGGITLLPCCLRLTVYRGLKVFRCAELKWNSLVSELQRQIKFVSPSHCEVRSAAAICVPGMGIDYRVRVPNDEGSRSR